VDSAVIDCVCRHDYMTTAEVVAHTWGVLVRLHDLRARRRHRGGAISLTPL
jgi:hypothetical protein